MCPTTGRRRRCATSRCAPLAAESTTTRSTGGTPEDRRVGAFSWSAIAGQGMIPAEAISDAVVWLCSDAAARVTGVALPIDSGHMILPGANNNPLVDGPAKA